MKRILINATQREELRVAIVDGQKLQDLDIETASREQKKGNIYKGRITRVEPSLEACFVEYGGERHGFLPLKEVAPGFYNGDKSKLREGLEVIVQVEKEERGNKGAALTTYVSLAGRYLVLMPNNPKAGGVSRRAEGDEREEAKAALDALNLPDGMGLIIRSNGIGRSVEELQWDLDHRVAYWNAITEAAAKKNAPFLIFQENNILLRALRDYLRADINEVVIDNEEIFNAASEQMQFSMPADLNKLKLYSEEMPLFSRYQIESQIESAHEREVRLPSGGSIVIDRTEALTAIDINSARATGGGNIEETALNTNLEAAEEIARQMRLRDLGGLVVIDFIDMNSSKNQRDVEKRLEQSTEADRARIQLGRISRFGLLELSRQRLRPSLGEHAQHACPRCEGRGQIRSIESTGLSVLRLIEEEAMKDRTARVIVQLPVDAGTFLLNEKRAVIREIEARNRVQITVVPNATLQTPHFEIKRVRGDHLNLEDNASISYFLARNFDTTKDASEAQAPVRPAPRPAVAQIAPTAPPPPAVAAAEALQPVAKVADTAVASATLGSLIMQFLRWLGFGAKATPAPVEAVAPKPAQRSARGNSNSNSNDDDRGNRRRERGGRNNNRRGGRTGESRPDDRADTRGRHDPQPARTAAAAEAASASSDRNKNNDREEAANPAASDRSEGRSGRRRSRGGRGRSRSSGNAQDGNDNTSAALTTGAASVAVSADRLDAADQPDTLVMKPADGGAEMPAPTPVPQGHAEPAAAQTATTVDDNNSDDDVTDDDAGAPKGPRNRRNRRGRGRGRGKAAGTATDDASSDEGSPNAPMSAEADDEAPKTTSAAATATTEDAQSLTSEATTLAPVEATMVAAPEAAKKVDADLPPAANASIEPTTTPDPAVVDTPPTEPVLADSAETTAVKAPSATPLEEAAQTRAPAPTAAHADEAALEPDVAPHAAAPQPEPDNVSAATAPEPEAEAEAEAEAEVVPEAETSPDSVPVLGEEAPVQVPTPRATAPASDYIKRFSPPATDSADSAKEQASAIRNPP
ncbi:Rne/Rng family ribonuclease [Polycyclovorans algicola]|uniref:Rne/Rng family ribonuclease n=1 Tax=Polycyclovorans algicola TaxID=616992 RepID=UPI0004A768F7|nr:Rne/Rng family ribonuclease [Polycyclovorans algicola]